MQPHLPMVPWKNIARLSATDEKVREAAFEAQMLKQIGVQPATQPPRIAAVPDEIQISVTRDGQTTHYPRLQSVPASVREKILTAWQPPVTPAAPVRNHRSATLLNLMLPGAGHLYLGRTAIGATYAGAFLACFVTLVLVFLRAYSRYLEISMSGQILDGDNLELLSQAFPVGLLAGLLTVGLSLYLVSAIHLARSHS